MRTVCSQGKKAALASGPLDRLVAAARQALVMLAGGGDREEGAREHDGTLVDQAALSGLVASIIGLGMTVISVQRIRED